MTIVLTKLLYLILLIFSCVVIVPIHFSASVVLLPVPNTDISAADVQGNFPLPLVVISAICAMFFSSRNL